MPAKKRETSGDLEEEYVVIAVAADPPAPVLFSFSSRPLHALFPRATRAEMCVCAMTSLVVWMCYSS